MPLDGTISSPFLQMRHLGPSAPGDLLSASGAHRPVVQTWGGVQHLCFSKLTVHRKHLGLVKIQMAGPQPEIQWAPEILHF